MNNLFSELRITNIEKRLQPAPAPLIIVFLWFGFLLLFLTMYIISNSYNIISPQDDSAYLVGIAVLTLISGSFLRSSIGVEFSYVLLAITAIVGIIMTVAILKKDLEKKTFWQKISPFLFIILFIVSLLILYCLIYILSKRNLLSKEGV